MQNIQPVNPGQPGAAASALATVKSELGAVPNIFATMAQSPAAVDAYLAFSGALAAGVLGTVTREQIALAVAGESKCNYCASAHTALAKNLGLSASEATLNLAGASNDVRTAAILDFAREIVATRGRVDADVLTGLRATGVTDEEIVEIIATVCLNLFTNYFNHIANTEIDFPFVTTASWTRPSDFL